MTLLIVLEIFTIIVQKMVCDKLFIKKYNGYIFETAVWTSFFVLFNIFTYVDFVSVYFNALIFLLLFFLVLQLLYKDSLKKKLIFTMFMYLLGMGSEFLVYQGANMVGIIMKETMVSGNSRLYCAIMSKLIWYTAIRVTLLMWRKHWKTDVRFVDWLAALLVPVSSIFIAAAIIDLNPKSGEFLKFFAAGLVLMLNLLIFYLYDQVQENAIKRAEWEYVQRQSTYYARLNEEIGGYWYEVQSFRHDLKQRYILEQSYLQQGNYERLAEYYQESIRFLNKGKVVADTGNICIDNIINYKALLAEKRGIRIQGDFLVAFDMTLNEEDICNIIGNLLDNAVEAAGDVEEEDKMVNVKIKMEGTNLLVVVKNHYSGQRKKKGSTYLTTKEEGKGHGLGLKIVEQVVKKYHGEMTIEDDGCLFGVKICLYNIGLINPFL